MENIDELNYKKGEIAKLYTEKFKVDYSKLTDEEKEEKKKEIDKQIQIKIREALDELSLDIKQKKRGR